MSPEAASKTQEMIQKIHEFRNYLEDCKEVHEEEADVIFTSLLVVPLVRLYPIEYLHDAIKETSKKIDSLTKDSKQKDDAKE